VQAVAGTPTPEVRSILQAVVQRFPSHPPGPQAAKALAKLEPSAPGPSAEALSGDLELFALPNLLQSLQASESTGDLVLFDRSQARQGSISMARGRVVRCEAGRLRGPDAVYQMLEKPFPGTFAFRSTGGAGKGASSSPASPPADSLEVVELILEGLRRHDEYHQARAAAPDGIVLEPAGVAALRPEGESDDAFARTVWDRAAAGTPPEACESEVATDAYRVRRLYAAWIEQGALRARVERPT
jgi:hypothetical protein